MLATVASAQRQIQLVAQTARANGLAIAAPHGLRPWRVAILLRAWPSGGFQRVEISVFPLA